MRACLFEGERQHGIEDLCVTRKPVQHAAAGVRVKEGYWQPEHAVLQRIVQVRRRTHLHTPKVFSLPKVFDTLKHREKTVSNGSGSIDTHSKCTTARSR